VGPFKKALEYGGELDQRLLSVSCPSKVVRLLRNKGTATDRTGLQKVKKVSSNRRKRER